MLPIHEDSIQVTFPNLLRINLSITNKDITLHYVAKVTFEEKMVKFFLFIVAKHTNGTSQLALTIKFILCDSFPMAIQVMTTCLKMVNLCQIM